MISSTILLRTVLISTLLLLAGCQDQEEEVQVTPLTPLPIDPNIQSVTRQMSQVEAEKRAIQQELSPETALSDQAPPPSEEHMRQAGEIIRTHYKKLGRMPTRPEMANLLSQEMNLGPPATAQAQAHAILDMMMLD